MENEKEIVTAESEAEKTEETAEEVKAEAPAEEAPAEEAKEEASAEEVKEEAKEEAPAEEVKEETKEETPAEEAKEEAKAEEKAAEETPSKETKDEAPAKEVKDEAKTETKPEKKGSGKKKAIIGIGAAAVALVVIAVIAIIAIVAIVLAITLHRSKVNMNDYITIETSGYNGYGKATYVFDEDRFYEENENKFKMSNAIKKYVNDNELFRWGLMLYDIDVNDKKDAAKLFIVGTELEGGLSQYSGLSNGDVITFSWDSDYDDEEMDQIAKKFKVKVNYSDIEYTVSGLQEVPRFDPFDGVEVSFSGISPNGQALIADYPDNGLYYSIEGDNKGLKNGDEITVKIQYPYGVDEYISDYEKVPDLESKAFRVEGLGEYLTSASQIPESALEEMKAQSNDIILGTTYNWVEGFSLDINYIGNYFLTAKDSVSSPNNMLVLVYKMHYENTVKDVNKKDVNIYYDYYFYVNWDDVQFAPDGSFVYSEKDYYKTKNDLNVEWDGVETGHYSHIPYRLHFIGYEKLDDIYNAYITRNIENYKFEENIDESLAAIPEENTEEDVEENAEETE